MMFNLHMTVSLESTLAQDILVASMAAKQLKPLTFSSIGRSRTCAGVRGRQALELTLRVLTQ